jgi:hypothetical protein
LAGIRDMGDRIQARRVTKQKGGKKGVEAFQLKVSRHKEVAEKEMQDKGQIRRHQVSKS